LVGKLRPVAKSLAESKSGCRAIWNRDPGQSRKITARQNTGLTVNTAHSSEESYRGRSFSARQKYALAQHLF
jgi:hypothetical protein